jgi:hypothetical protein
LNDEGVSSYTIIMNRDDIVRRLEAGRDRMAAHFAVPRTDLDKTYRAGGWSVGQILEHVADCEVVNLWRFVRAVAEPGSVVEPFEENHWAERLAYGTRPPELSRDLFLAARNTIIHHVRSLPESRLDGRCRHPEKGELSGWQWATYDLGHCDHHLGQLDAARAGRPWVGPGDRSDGLYGARSAIA